LINHRTQREAMARSVAYIERHKHIFKELLYV
jgi:hypothetical protein